MISQSDLTGDPYYAPLDLRSIHSDLPVISDLYLEAAGQYVLYREESLPFRAADRDRLLASGVSNLWVRIPTEPDMRWQQQLTSLLALPDDAMSPLAKAGLLYTSARAITQRTIYDVSNERLTQVGELVSTTVAYLVGSRNAFPTLLSAMAHDFSIYSHSVNVAMYALGLSRFIGITDRENLRDVGIGAIFHDIGKIRVPKEILNKAGPLSPRELVILRRHPDWGKELLSPASDISEVMLAIITQHHERLDGSGYPRGLTGESLHQFSKIVALVDAFEAMTSSCPYTLTRTPNNALSVLNHEAVMTGQMDAALFAGMVRLFGNPSQAGFE